MTKISDLIAYAKKEFSNISHKTALEILAGYLNKNNSYILAHPELLLSDIVCQKFQVALQELTAGKPLAYILNQEKFFERDFYVDENTLIPRVETELLVELVLKQFLTTENISVLDLGTGSGNIAISLAAAQPHWEITAVDNNESALEVAKKNAMHLSLLPRPRNECGVTDGAQKNINSNQIDFIVSNWFENIPSSSCFHAIVSNPPYIAANDSDVCSSVRNFEPHCALFAKDDGLADLKIIIEGAKKYLYPGGMLAVEHGHTQHAAVKKLFEENGYQNIYFVVDHQDIRRVCYGFKET